MNSDFGKTAALILPVILALVMAGSVAAQSARTDLEPAPEPPPPPEPLRSGEAIEPEITIIPGREQTVTEYRVGGRLVAVKIEPRDAPAYFLVDADGDGALESQRHGLAPQHLVNGWVLFRW